MKKKILATLLGVLLASSLLGTTVLAQDIPEGINDTEISEEFTTYIDLNQCKMYRKLPDGTIIPVVSPRLALSSHTIEPGETMYYSYSNGSEFKLFEDERVSFSARFDSRISYECGLYLDGNHISMKSGTASSFSVIHTVEEEGYYQLYITNNSSDTVTVKSGTIAF